jgi:hypothetical protein
MKDGRIGGRAQQTQLLDHIGSVSMLALSTSSLEQQQQPSMRQAHKRIVLMHWVTSDRALGLIKFGARQLAGEVATYQGRHQQLRLLLHQWTSTSPILGMN